MCDKLPSPNLRLARQASATRVQFSDVSIRSGSDTFVPERSDGDGVRDSAGDVAPSLRPPGVSFILRTKTALRRDWGFSRIATLAVCTGLGPQRYDGGDHSERGRFLYVQNMSAT